MMRQTLSILLLITMSAFVSAFVRNLISQNRRLRSNLTLANRFKSNIAHKSTKHPCSIVGVSTARLASSSSEGNESSKKKKKKKAKVEYDFDEESLAAAFASLGPIDGSYKVSDKEMAELRRLDEIELARLNDPTNLDDFESDDDDDFAIEFIDDDEDFVDFDFDDASTSMADRMAAARRDASSGRISVPDELDDFARDASFDDLEAIGFKREENPFGRDETPRNPLYSLEMKPMECPACGSYFQSRDVSKPGFLPPEKHKYQMKLAKQIAEQKKSDSLKENGEEEWSVDDEIEWLLQNADGESNEETEVQEKEEPDHLTMADQIDLLQPKKQTICQRCHNLQNFGDIDASLRPGWTDEPLLSQESFRELLKPIREKDAIIIALVDLFDFSGSILPELDSIAGKNPVILAANKADLLPTKMGQLRVENWVRRELEYMGIKSLANIGGAVRLVSCKTGFGISQMLRKVQDLADERDCDVYIVGAANAGKSTLLNRMLQSAEDNNESDKPRRKKRAGNANSNKGLVTTSPLPGTTLKFIKVKLGNGRKMYDTPGLLVPGTLTSRLTPAELKMVVPKKPVEPVTFRVEPGKCVLVGGLARIEVLEVSKAFMLTFYVSNDIKLHPTDTDRADEVLRKHAGEMITPPLPPGIDRLKEIGEFEYHDIVIDGAGWKEAAADISLRGLGWVSVTGAGTANIRIGVPKGIGISVRPPLMPFDVWDATARYTGAKAVRKSGRSKTGKYKKGVGRR